LKIEYEGCGPAMDDLARALQQAMKDVEQIRSSHGKDDKFDHITDEEVKKVERTIQSKWSWLEEKRILLNQTPRTQQPPVYINQIRAEKQVRSH
jgi:hypothetical protein